MKPFARSQRVSGEIQRVLSDLLQRHIKDPRLKMTTITRVRMSADLRIARIYYATAGARANQDQVADGFKSAQGFVKRTLAHQLGLRYMPALEFYYDDSFDYGSHIDQLLKSLDPESDNPHLDLEHGPDHPPAEK